jgi:hypothetical protein
MFRSVNHPENQSKTEAYQRIEAILAVGPFLADTRAVHRAYFLYELRWSQVGARISEMPDSEWRSGVRTAYRLDSKPVRVPRGSSESDYPRRTKGKAAAAMLLFGEPNS